MEVVVNPPIWVLFAIWLPLGGHPVLWDCCDRFKGLMIAAQISQQGLRTQAGRSAREAVSAWSHPRLRHRFRHPRRPWGHGSCDRLDWKTGAARPDCRLAERTRPADRAGPRSEMARGTGRRLHCAYRSTARLRPAPEPMVFRYALHDGAVGWRAMSACRLSGGGPIDGILLDRGLATRLGGAMAPSRTACSRRRRVVTGVLRDVGAKPLVRQRRARSGGFGDRAASDRSATPSTSVAAKLGAHPSGVRCCWRSSGSSRRPRVWFPRPCRRISRTTISSTPATWFALAGILAWFYVALLWRRLRSR